MTRACIIALAATAALSTPAFADEIREIVVVENSKTTDDTVRFIAGIEEGDDWDSSKQDEIRIDLVSSGLFKEVDIYSEPHPKGGVKVTIIAKDKHSWIIAPTYYNQPTNKGGGVGYGENNLFGENKKLLLYGQVATGDSFFIGAYVDPSIKGTRFSWQFDLFLQNERVKEYRPPRSFTEDAEDIIVLREQKTRYFNAGVKFGVTLFRSMSFDARLRGAHVSYTEPELATGALESEIDPSLTDGCVADGSCTIPKPGAEGFDVSWEGILKFDRRANWYGIQTGSLIKLTYEQGLPQLGSEFEYKYVSASLMLARKFFEKHNLIWKIRGAGGNDLPFQHEYVSGGTTLRGYKGSQFRGDFKLSQNLEYSVQLFNIKGLALRALVFGDVAYTKFMNPFSSVDECGDDPVVVGTQEQCRHYLVGARDVDEFGDIGMDSGGNETLRYLRTSFGVGTRIYIRQIVLPLLGLDLGYSPESGGYEVYFAIGLTDL